MDKIIDLDTITKIEKSFEPNDPFGNTDLIINRTDSIYRFWIEVLSERFEELQSIHDQLEKMNQYQSYKILCDPVMRDSINSAIGYFKNNDDNGTDQVRRLFKIMTPSISQTTNIGPLGKTMPITIFLDKTDTWIWNTNTITNPIQEQFNLIFRREITTNPPVILVPPDANTISRLDQGFQLLAKIFQFMSLNIIKHVQTIAIVNVDNYDLNLNNPANIFPSASTDAIPGSILISPLSLVNAWETAEAIFHEGLHNKIYDIYLSSSIFLPGSKSSKFPTIKAIWNKSSEWNSNEWPISRALAAFHVYVHLCLFYILCSQSSLLIDRKDSYLKEIKMFENKAHRAYLRASYLGNQLQGLSEGILDNDGIKFVDWLLDILKTFDQFNIK